ncbi:hypothetical protein [Roseiconus lacunae]|uniref:hypothetical protein n=1 Tax=Roseiconus lacunae TaxID=2605694 RepID=UPI001E542107|nr:hypothetical protein [Roseiconus lacunae]MCD0463052.1 hypothetical protein [Roseiconus lacunae]
MSETLIVELRTSNTADVDQLKETFANELAKQNAELSVSNMKKIEAVGMTTSDLILSVIISLGSSAAVHVYRDEIDAAAKAASKLLKTDVRTFFRGDQKSIEDDE